MRSLVAALLLIVFAGWVCAEEAGQPLALHPENPHYFLFRGQPTFLITSAEHYGAVLNSKFDQEKYLHELAAHGLSNTRVFTGAYVEDAKAFNIARNTLAPKSDDFLCPWARSDKLGYAGGGNKFDLQQWDDRYFARLNQFMQLASKRGVVVEMNLFCPFYEDAQWNLSPQNPTNNVQAVGPKNRTEVYTLDKHAGLLEIQVAMVQKIVTELNEFDNLYYEICNEPYFGGVTLDWQHRIVDTIVAAEKQLPRQHLISLNVANGSAKIIKPHPAVSIFNFHYASPPTAVAENYALDKAIGDNETGFKGIGDTHYRREAWEFLLSGGALYNNLDYSFVVGHEEGTFAYSDKQPGGGNTGFRRQMHTLKTFLASFDFVHMHPDTNVVKKRSPDKTHVTMLSRPGEAYAGYFFGEGPAELTLQLKLGNYHATWLDPTSGKTIAESEVTARDDGTASLTSPPLKPDLALRLMRTK